MEDYMKKAYMSDSIFWVEVDRITPNPFQPRKTFDEAALDSLAESIRQYGVLNPLTVTKREVERPGEGIFVEYELIAGERRLRAAKKAGVQQVPVVIRRPEDSDRLKLELAIIENLQREDLNPIDRARAFKQLVDAFGMKHVEIGKRIGKSREYVSNSLRILMLPQDMLDALAEGKINEGHTRPLLMLIDKPEEQKTLFQEILTRKLSVRDAEQLSRRVAFEKARKHTLTPDLLVLERQLTEQLGTRVRIEKKDEGGKVLIDFFSPEDLAHLCMVLAHTREGSSNASSRPPQQQGDMEAGNDPARSEAPRPGESAAPELAERAAAPVEADSPEEDLYSARNFTV